MPPPAIDFIADDQTEPKQASGQIDFQEDERAGWEPPKQQPSPVEVAPPEPVDTTPTVQTESPAETAFRYMSDRKSALQASGEWDKLDPIQRYLREPVDPKQSELSKWLGAFGTIATNLPRLVGKGLGFEGKALAAGVGKILGTGDTLENAARSVMTGEPLPVEAAAEKIPGLPGALAQGGLNVVETIPKLGLLAAFPGSWFSQALAAGGIFGLDDQGNFTVKGAVLGAIMGGAGSLAQGAVARALTKGIQSGSTALKNPVAQFVLEELGQQAALNAVMIAGDSPEIIALYKQDPKAARDRVVKLVEQNLAWVFLGAARHYIGGGPTRTEAFILKNAEKYGDIADEMLTKKIVGKEGQKVIVDALESAKDWRARMPGAKQPEGAVPQTIDESFQEALGKPTIPAEVTGDQANAIQIRSPAPLPVDETSGRSAEVVGQIRQPEGVALPPAEERPQQGQEAAPNPPAQAVAAPKPLTLTPALLVNGVPVTGIGRHKDIAAVAGQEAKVAGDTERQMQIIEAQADDSKHVFVDQDGNVLSRAQAAPVFKEITGKDVSNPKFGLTSEDLIAEGLQKPAPDLTRVAPEPIVPPVAAPGTSTVPSAEVQGMEGGKAPTPAETAPTGAPKATSVTAEPGESPGRSAAAVAEERTIHNAIRVAKADLKLYEKRFKQWTAAGDKRKAAAYLGRITTTKQKLVDLQGRLTMVEPAVRQSAKRSTGTGITEEDGDLKLIVDAIGQIPVFMPSGAVMRRYDAIMRRKASRALLTMEDKNFLNENFPANYEDDFGARGETARAAYDAADEAGIAGELFTPIKSAGGFHFSNVLNSIKVETKGKLNFANGQDLFTALAGMAKAHYERTRGRRTEGAQAEAASREEQEFITLTRDLDAKTKGTEPLLPEKLEVGYEFTLKGTKVKVESIELDPDEDGRITAVVLSDGNKYGTHRVPIGEGRYELRMDVGSLKENGRKVVEVDFAPESKPEQAAPEVPADPFSVGRKVRFGNNPQPWTILEETTDPKFPDERLFKVKNDRTGEVTETGQQGITAITAREAGGKPGPKRDLDAELKALKLDPSVFPDNKSKLAAIKRARAKQGMLGEAPGIQVSFGGGNAILTPPTEMGKKALPAHHGTPHEVDRFSLEKVGTGEGAQVYGWGLYFAEHRAVAESYAKPQVDPEKVRALTIQLAEIHGDIQRAETQWDKRDKTDAVESGRLEAALTDFRRQYKWVEQQLNAEEGGGKGSNIYTVDILANPEEMLDWDKPISDSQKRLIASKLPNGHWETGAMGERRWREPAAELNRSKEITGSAIYDFLQNTVFKGNAKSASEYLASLGIPGIRYLDQGSRQFKVGREYETDPNSAWIVTNDKNQIVFKDAIREKAEAYANSQRTYNYVIFDESKIRITHKNGQPVPLKQAMIEAEASANPAGRGMVHLRDVDELRALIRSGESGLQPEAQKLITAFLDSPLGRFVDVRVRIADALEHGWQGSYFDGIVELARNAKPDTGPHEFGHRIWELLPKDIRDQFEAMRVAAINDRLNKPGNSFQIPILTDLRDMPISGGEDFTNRGYDQGPGRELYPLSSAEEFFTHALSKAFREKVDAKGAALITRVKDMVREFVAVLRKALGLSQSQDQLLRNIMAGRYDISPETGIAAEQNRRKQQGSLATPESPITPEQLKQTREDERFRQVYGARIGAQYTPESIKTLVQGVRSNFDGTTQPITPERTKNAFDILAKMTDPTTRQGYANGLMDAVGQPGAAAALRNELWSYSVRLLMQNNGSLFNAMRLRSAEIETRDFGGAVVGASASGLDLRIAQEMVMSGLWAPVLEYTKQERIAAGERLGVGPDAFADILRAMNDISSRIDPVEWERVIQTGKDKDGRSLADIIRETSPERKAAEEVVQTNFPIEGGGTPGAGGRGLAGAKRGGILETVYRYMAQDVRDTPDQRQRFFESLSEELTRNFALSQEKANTIADQTWNRKMSFVTEKTRRMLDAELRALDNLAEKTAQGFIARWAQAEWLKPEQENPIRDIVKDALKSTTSLDTSNIQNFRTAFEALLAKYGLSKETARDLSLAVWNKREMDLANAQMRARQKAAESLSVGSLIESIKSSPYLAQSDPAWRLETARLWFVSNGLDGASALVAAKQFDAQFQIAYARAAERIATDLLRNKDPRTVQELVAAVRSGLLDPASDWTAKLASGLSAPEITELTDLQLKQRAGTLTPAETKRFDALATKSRLKFRPLSTEQFATLAKLEEKLADPSINPYEQVAIVEQMMGVMRHGGDQTGHFWKAAGESFAASLLSGIRTSTLQVGQPLFHQILTWGVHALAEPRDFFTLTHAAWEATKNFAPEFAYSWVKDASGFDAESAGLWKNELKRQFEIAERDWKAGHYAKAIPRFAYGWQQYVIRTLRAFDQAGMSVVREYSMSLYGSMAMRAAGFTTSEIAELVHVTAGAKNAAYQEYLHQGKTKLEARAMADYDAALMLKAFFRRQTKNGLEMISWKRSEEIAEAGVYEAHNMTGRRAPGVKEIDEGMLSQPLNWLMTKATEARREGGPASILTIMAVGFMNVPLRASRYYAGWGPYGLLRWGIHSYMQNPERPGAAWLRKKASEIAGEERTTFWNQSYKNDLMAKARLREALVGTGLMLAFVGWQANRSTADDDAEKRKFGLFVTGNGPANKTLRDAWLKRGFQPYMLNIIVDGKVAAAIPMTRAGQILAYPLGIAAAIDDVAWKHKQNMALGRPAKDPVADEVLMGISTYYNIVGAQGIFQAAGHISQLAQGGGGIGRAIGVTAAGTAAALVIPGKSLLQGVSDMVYGPIDRSSVSASMMASFPVLNAWVNGKAINRFGDVIGDRSWYAKLITLGAPIAIRVADTQENRAMYQLVLDTGAAPPDLRRYIVEEKYGPLTQPEWNKFAKVSGDTLKQSVLDNLDQLKTYPPEAVRQFMMKAGESANAQAAATLNLEPVPQPGRAGGVAAYSSGAGGGGAAADTGAPSISLPKAPNLSSLGLPQAPSGAGGGTRAGAGGTTNQTLIAAPARLSGTGTGGITRRIGLGGVGRIGGMTRRVSLGRVKGKARGLVTGRLRARSGHVRRVRLPSTRRTRRLTFKG